MFRRVSQNGKTKRQGRAALAAPALGWAAAVAVMVFAHGGGSAVAGRQAAPSLKDGVYTEAQAARGKALYQAQCITCHLEQLNGTPPLAGEVFRAKWAPLTAADLFRKMRDTMPTPEPGMLEPDEYVDIVAYVLKENQQPAGTQELKSDAALLKQLPLADLAATH